MGDVIGDLNSRRGQIQGMDFPPRRRADRRTGASERDVWLCHGPAFPAPRAAASIPWSRHSYVEIPKNIADKIIAERGRKDGE